MPARQKVPADRELKFTLSPIAARRALDWLRLRLRSDRSYPAAVVSSIYFDTRDGRFLRDKLSSDYHKTKVRIRWYEELDGSPGAESFLEVKSKLGSQRSKRRLPGGFSGRFLAGARLDHPSLQLLDQRLWEEGVALPGPLLPFFVVRYVRHRFIEPASGSRVCLDTKIEVPRVNPRVFPRRSAASLQASVFELKGELCSLPPVLHQLTAFGARRGSFSKYLSCYQMIMGRTQ